MASPVVQVHHEITAAKAGEVVHAIGNERAAQYGEGRFGTVQRERKQPCPEPGGQEHGFHGTTTCSTLEELAKQLTDILL